MKRLRAFLERLPGGHRPPTGPLTTEEKTEADESQAASLSLKDDEKKRAESSPSERPSD
jgi:hypothetical protein